MANKNKNKTSDGISTLIRKMSRWTIICEENFVWIKKDDDVLWLFQIRKKIKKDYSVDEWFDWCCLYLQKRLLGAGAECVVPIWNTTTVVMVNSKMNIQHQKTLTDFSFCCRRTPTLVRVSTGSDGNRAVYGHYD